MNVLEVVSGYVPYHQAGVPKHIARLCCGLLAEPDICIDIVAQEIDPAPDARPGRFRLPQYPLRGWSHKREWMFRWFDWVLTWWGPELCRRRKIQLIHGHTWPYGGRQAINLGRKCGLPVVVTLHGTVLDQFTTDRPPDWARELRGANHLIVQKPSAREKLIAWGYPAEAISILIGPVAGSAGSAKGKSFEPPLRLLFAGRFDPIKRPEMLIELASQIKSRRLPFLLTAVGDGPLLASIRNEAGRRQLDDVIAFPGWCRDMAQLYSEYHVILGLSDRHNVSDLVLLEGMSCGLLPLVTQSLDIDYLIQDEVNGLIGTDNVAELLDRIAGFTPAELCKMANQASETAVRIASLAALVRHHRKIFDELVAT